MAMSDAFSPETVNAISEAKFRDRVRAARRQSPGDKIRAAFELFESACGLMRSGILHDNPALSEDELRREMRRRFRIARQLDEANCYRRLPEEEVPEEWRA